MSQGFLLNIIPFPSPVQKLECSISGEKRDEYVPVHRDDIQKEIIDELVLTSKLPDALWYYADFSEPDGSGCRITVDLTQSVYFANHYYRYLIRNYFRNIADIMYPTFTNDIEVWFVNEKLGTKKYSVYNVYTLKIQHARITDGPEMVLSFDGTTKVLKKSLQELSDFPTDKLNWINCLGELHRYKYMPPHFKQDLDKLYPVVSNPLKTEFEITFDTPDFKNRYPKYLAELESFYNVYLKNSEFISILPLSSKGFHMVSDDEIQRTNMESNDLMFGKGKNVSPLNGMKNYGPYKASPHNNVRFFFIYHEPDREKYIKVLYQYLTEGYYKTNESGELYQSFPDLVTYIKQPLYFEKEDSIAFKSTSTIVEEIRNALLTKDLKQDIRYIALYISPISKLNPDLSKHIVYYRVKELLLQRGITSQVIYKENIFNRNFQFFLPNIEIALLAKIGGIPWRLNRLTSNELIVGIGAFYSKSRKNKYVGSAFCFNNEGIFEGFDCFLANEITMLAGSIRKAVLKYLVDHETANRLIIHFYKTISKKELIPIIDILNKLGLSIPVIIVSINKTESKELLAFDMSSKDLMPLSGSIVKVGKFDYLLFNNTRYYETSRVANREYHFPLKISFACSKPELLEDQALIRELMDQVYQFSRMYWKSVSQQSLPVTIKYPEMVAQIYPHFQNDKLPEFAQKNLWFL